MTAHNATNAHTLRGAGAAPSVSSSLFITSLGCLLYVLAFFVVVGGGVVVVVVVDVVVVRGDVTGHHRDAVAGVGADVVCVGPHTCEFQFKINMKCIFSVLCPVTLKTIFMLCVVHRPPIRRWRSSLVDVEMK